MLRGEETSGKLLLV